MTRYVRVWGLLGALVLGGMTFGLVLILVAESRAADPGTEQRDFIIYVDGDQAGSYSMSITQRDDGSQTMSSVANVRVKYLGGLKVYRYSYQGTETWKGGRLVHFNSTSNDDGKEFTVLAVPGGNGLRIRVNSRERVVRPDIWLTTYWHLVDPRFRNGGVPLVDADTRELQNCTHYRVSGDTQAELWYDSQERLIRLRSWSDGHRYELVLSRIRR
jgi:hypothetical protein